MKTPRTPQCISIRIFPLLAGILGFFTPAARADNLILNGSFEDPNFNPWSTPVGYVIDPSNYNPTQSNYHFLPASDGSHVFSVSSSYWVSQPGISLTAGQTYHLSFDLSVYQDQSSAQLYDAGFNLLISDNHDNFGQSYFVAAGTPSWIHESYDFTAGDTANYVVQFYVPYPVVHAFNSVLDNVVLQSATVPDEPYTAALLGLSLPVLAMLRRRQRS